MCVTRTRTTWKLTRKITDYVVARQISNGTILNDLAEIPMRMGRGHLSRSLAALTLRRGDYARDDFDITQHKIKVCRTWCRKNINLLRINCVGSRSRLWLLLVLRFLFLLSAILYELLCMHLFFRQGFAHMLPYTRLLIVYSFI